MPALTASVGAGIIDTDQLALWVNIPRAEAKQSPELQRSQNASLSAGNTASLAGGSAATACAAKASSMALSTQPGAQRARLLCAVKRRK